MLGTLGSEIAPLQAGPNVWYGPEVLQRESEWLLTLTKAELDELLAAAKLLAESSPGEDFLNIDALEKFDTSTLSTLTARVNSLKDILHKGLGFFIWRGIPVDTWSHKEVYSAFLILGKCFGNLRRQNAKGFVLAHVKDVGLATADPNVRVHQTSERLTFHADSADVASLLCLKTAKSGGHSSLVSAGAVYNEILTKSPDLARELFQTFPTDRRGEVADGALPYYNIPVFSWYQGYLSVMYQRQYTNSSQRFPDAPRLSEKQVAALDLFDAVCNDPKLNFTMVMKPGDLQFVHSLSTLHDRTGFEDWPEPERKRHLLRLWISTLEARPLPPVFAHRFGGSTVVGQRGGVHLPGVKPIIPLHL